MLYVYLIKSAGKQTAKQELILVLQFTKFFSVFFFKIQSWLIRFCLLVSNSNFIYMRFTTWKKMNLTFIGEVGWERGFHSFIT